MHLNESINQCTTATATANYHKRSSHLQHEPSAAQHLHRSVHEILYDPGALSSGLDRNLLLPGPFSTPLFADPDPPCPTYQAANARLDTASRRVLDAIDSEICAGVSSPWISPPPLDYDYITSHRRFTNPGSGGHYPFAARRPDRDQCETQQLVRLTRQFDIHLDYQAMLSNHIIPFGEGVQS